MNLYKETIYTNRLRLRKVTQGDLPLLVAWSQSQEAHGEYLTPTLHSLSDFMLQWESGTLWNPRNKTYLIELRHTETPLGLIHHWQKEGLPTHVAMALKIARPEERCKGYGTEAQKFLIMHLLDHAEARIIDMHTDIGNHAQQRCLAKLGFANVKALEYQDQQMLRTGFIYRLTRETYMTQPIYRYHYE
jgi:RimJ/RimL family protein N-acetyltransferase